jgi:hypothetical protein
MAQYRLLNDWDSENARGVDPVSDMGQVLAVLETGHTYSTSAITEIFMEIARGTVAARALERQRRIANSIERLLRDLENNGFVEQVA